jgi:uncharacterized protein DUF6328
MKRGSEARDWTTGGDWRVAPHDREEDGGRNETPLERLDRNLEELLSELRIVVTGVQVLFAFLLVVPFNVGFVHIGPFQRGVYFVTLLFAALAALCMLAPPAHHRILFRCDDKRHIVFTANRLMIMGLGSLALAMCGSLLLVATKLFGVTTGLLTVAIAAILFLVIWFGLPLVRKARLSSRSTVLREADAGARAAATEVRVRRLP